MTYEGHSLSLIEIKGLNFICRIKNLDLASWRFLISLSDGVN